MFNMNPNEKARKKLTGNVSIGIGGTLIMVMFVVLCLTIFAILSFTTANSDLKLSKKTEESIADYYDIHGRAEEKLSEVYQKLIDVQNELMLETENNISITDKFYVVATQKIMALDDLSIIKSYEDNQDNYLTIYYEVFGELNQKICVTLNILYDEIKNQPYYEIVSWNLSNINLPGYEEELYDLWEGVNE